MLKDRLPTSMKEGISTRWLRRRRPSKASDTKEIGPLAALDECKARSDLWSAVIPGILLEDSFLPLQQLNETASIDRMMTLMDRLDGQDMLDAEFDVEGDLVIKLSKSFETVATEEDDSEPEADTEITKELNSKRTIRWSDEVGSDLETIHSFERPVELSVRVVILLLNPADRKFEFMHCEYTTDDKLKISDLLQQIPGMALNPYFRKKQFRSLCIEQTELLNMLPIQDYYVGEGMILTAVCAGDNVKQTMLASEELLSNKMLRRTVRKAKLSGRALQRLKTSQEWNESKTGCKGGKKCSPEAMQRLEKAFQEEDSFDGIHTLTTLKESMIGPLHEQLEDEECSAIDNSDSQSFLSISSISDEEFLAAATAMTTECEDVTFVLDEWICDDLVSVGIKDNSSSHINVEPVAPTIEGKLPLPESSLVETEGASSMYSQDSNAVACDEEPLRDNEQASNDHDDDSLEPMLPNVAEEDANANEIFSEGSNKELHENHVAPMTLNNTDETTGNIHNGVDLEQGGQTVREVRAVWESDNAEEGVAVSKAQDDVGCSKQDRCMHENLSSTNGDSASFVPISSEMESNFEIVATVSNNPCRESSDATGDGLCEDLTDANVDSILRNASTPESVIDEANWSASIISNELDGDDEMDKITGTCPSRFTNADETCPFDEEVADSSVLGVANSKESESDYDIHRVDSQLEHFQRQPLFVYMRSTGTDDYEANCPHTPGSHYVDIEKNSSEEITEASDTFSELADQDTPRTIVGVLEDSWSPEQHRLHMANMKLGTSGLIRNLRNLVLSNRSANRYHRTPPD